MEAFINFITSFGIFAILFVIFAETGLLIGFIFPGDSLLFTAGFLVQQGVLPINIHTFVALLFTSAVLGESTGYLFGRKVGRKLFERENSRFFKKDYLIRSELFYQKHGAITIVLACFIPFVRTFVPIVAGISHMDYRKFIPFNLLGAALWTGSFTYLGYYAGAVLRSWGINVEVAAIIIILLSISPMIVHYFKDHNNRLRLIAGTKRQINTLLRK
ncbi:VTT domain-containing protein [Candidatus Saccharibacteria bacterium]|nr:VTT domain-containing protein [Candidatus Saccharibacteria bacterium]